MRTFLILSLAALSIASVQANDGQVTVNFSNVEDYTDFKPSSGIEERFQSQRQAELSQYFNELAKQLPSGQQLSVTVTDIDLAGRLEPTFGQSASNFIRIVRSIDYPSIAFTYQLRDSAGTLLREDSVQLQDMNFDFDSVARKRAGYDSLFYEKKMLKGWFNKTFEKVSSVSQPAESA